MKRVWIAILVFVGWSLVGETAPPPQLFNQRNQPVGGVQPNSNIGQAVPKVQQEYSLSLPSRFQWFNNHGYCGETSLIVAGLYYGQYVSQYTARQTVGGVGPGSQSNNQILLGVNDAMAATAMHLDYVTYQSPAGETNKFLTWVKAYILNDCPVTIGVYENQCLFYGGGNCHSSSAGDPTYDHIVPVTGIKSSDLPLPPIPPPPFPTYYSDDVIIFSDNGLEGPEDNPTNSPCLPNPADPYLFQYTFNGFQNTRRDANDPSGQWYSLGDEVENYAIAILGVKDLNGDTIPVTVATNVGSSSCRSSGYLNYEFPEIINGSDTRPVSLPLSLTVTVAISDPSQSYNLYRYDDLTMIPDSMFNANAGMSVQSWVIPANYGSTYTVIVNITSDQVAAFRAVSTTAP